MNEITPQNILRHELIGLSVKVVRATNSSTRAIRGIVVDETKNMLSIDTKERRVRIPKNIATFRFNLPSGIRVDIDGARLVARPENRLKARVRRW